MFVLITEVAHWGLQKPWPPCVCLWRDLCGLNHAAEGASQPALPCGCLAELRVGLSPMAVGWVALKTTKSEHVSKALLSALKCPHGLSEQRLWGQSLWGRARDTYLCLHAPLEGVAEPRNKFAAAGSIIWAPPDSRFPGKKQSFGWLWELKNLLSGPLQFYAGVQLLSATFPLVLAQSNAGWVAVSSICWAARGMGLVFQSSCVTISQAVM